MKKFLSIIALFFVVLTVSARAKIYRGSLATLQDADTISVQFDVSKTKFDKDLYKDDDILDYKRELKQASADVLLEKFCRSVNGRLFPVRTIFVPKSTSTNAKVTLIIKPESIDDDGEIQGYGYFYDAATDEEIAVISFKGNGGMFGSHLNLMGDGMVDAGDSIGALIKRSIK